MGVEYVKLAKTFDVSQMIMLPFTRCLLGPADVTPGAFLNVREDAFVPNSIPATCPGTRARQLALAVLADSPFLCLCDGGKTTAANRASVSIGTCPPPGMKPAPFPPKS